jgi:hypothetical protein
MSERREPGIADTIGHSLLGGIPTSRGSFLSSERSLSSPRVEQRGEAAQEREA